MVYLILFFVDLCVTNIACSRHVRLVFGCWAGMNWGCHQKWLRQRVVKAHHNRHYHQRVWAAAHRRRKAVFTKSGSPKLSVPTQRHSPSQRPRGLAGYVVPPYFSYDAAVCVWNGVGMAMMCCKVTSLVRGVPTGAELLDLVLQISFEQFFSVRRRVKKSFWWPQPKLGCQCLA